MSIIKKEYGKIHFRLTGRTFVTFPLIGSKMYIISSHTAQSTLFGEVETSSFVLEQVR